MVSIFWKGVVDSGEKSAKRPKSTTFFCRWKFLFCLLVGDKVKRQLLLKSGQKFNLHS